MIEERTHLSPQHLSVMRSRFDLMESTEKAQASIKSEFSKEVSLEADFPGEIKSEDF